MTTVDQFSRFDLSGRTALVTGGGAGIGFNIAHALLQAGASVMIASRQKDVLDEAACRLAEACRGGIVHSATVDLADPAQISALAEHAVATMAAVDIFVGNAAQIEQAPIEQVLDEHIDRMLQINVAANIQLCRALLPQMRRRKWGRIIFCSSVNSICAPPEAGLSVYTASKGAMNAFARAAAAEVGIDGVTVNSMVLGVFLTEMSRSALAALDETHGPGSGDATYSIFGKMSALGRWGDCEEIEPVVQLLASNAGSFITGSNIVLDGGITSMLHPRTMEPAAP